MEVAGIWKRYKCDPTDVDMRNRLIDHYFPLVHHHARKIASRFRSPVIDYDDLVSAGFFGMLDAFDSFDPDRGIQFATFSALRIRGAMFDETRRLDELSRLSRTRESHRIRVADQLRNSLGRNPTEDEIAAELGFESSKQMAEKSSPTQISIEELSDGFTSFRETFIDREDPPDRRMASRDQLYVIVQSLSKTEKMIVLLYYYEHLTMFEVAKAIGISESRVSQLHSRIVARLKELFAKRRDEFFKE